MLGRIKVKMILEAIHIMHDSNTFRHVFKRMEIHNIIITMYYINLSWNCKTDNHL